MKHRAELLVAVSWGTATVAAASVLFVWLEGLSWSLEGVTAYDLFPLLGLLAFVLMWSHYISGVLRLILSVDKKATRRYWTITSWIVLGAIILHPTILIFKLWQDGFGLPPNSYLEHYVAPGLKWAAALGAFSLLVFLAYELHRWFEARNWWPYVQAASDAAMLAVFVHGLRLGTHTGRGWFAGVWIFYGISLVVCLIYVYGHKLLVRKGMKAREK